MFATRVNSKVFLINTYMANLPIVCYLKPDNL
jgi:hypothetical protein